MRFSYNWLQSYFKKPLPQPGEIAARLIDHAFEVEATEKTPTDFLFEIKILPDRFADAANHYGLAREIAGLFELPLSELKAEKLKGPETDLAIEIKSGKCRRYLGQKINNIKVTSSPAWLAESLAAAGIRSINNVVDVTNFVMLSIGQPLHAFDADKIEKKIIIREAKPGEIISLLLEKGKAGERKIILTGGELLITDEAGGLALAGIKGGRRAEITERTQNIILESANFDPAATGRVSRKYGILTDSSRRFENNLSPLLAPKALALAAQLIKDTAGGDVEKAVDIYKEKPKPVKIKLKLGQINSLLGTNFKIKEIEDIFKRYNFDFKKIKENFVITVPSYRQDLLIAEDIIEEIGRIYGYDKIQSSLPEIAPPKPDKEFYYATKIRHFLRDLGFSEVYTYALVPQGEVAVKNPLAADKKFLRNNLTDNLKLVITENNNYLPLLGSDELLVFELGKVFKKEKEYNSLCLGLPAKMLDKILPQIEKNFSLDLKEGSKLLFEKFIVLEINFDELIDPLPLPKDYSDLNLEPLPDVKFQNISPYPFITRDVAVWLPSEEDPERLRQILVSEGGKLLARPPRLFDEFKKEGKKSYAYRLVFQSMERTLTDGEVNKIMEKIEEKIRSQGWQIR